MKSGIDVDVKSTNIKFDGARWRREKNNTTPTHKNDHQQSEGEQENWISFYKLTE